MSKKYIGIDIGGTNLKAGVVDESGALLATAKTPLEWTTEADFIKTLAELSAAAAAEAGAAKEEICAVGMGVPGEVDGERGLIVNTCNIPLSNVSIAEEFHKHWDVPVFLDNDANCAALGEFYAGAGKGCRNLIVITLGTGVGAGIIVNGRLLRGVNGAAGEAGHIVIERGGVPCPCGRRGCWEQYSSANGLKRMTVEVMKAHPESALWAHCEGNTDNVSGSSAFAVARRCGDETAKAVCAEYVSYLALGVTNLVNLFQPEMICIGGGVSNEEDEWLLFPLREQVAQERFGCNQERVTQIVKAKLGNDAGIIGAALLGMK